VSKLKLLTLLLLWPAFCQASRVVVIGNDFRAALQGQVDLASRFYGLDVRQAAVGSSQDLAAVTSLLKEPDTVAAVVDSEALPYLNREVVLASLRRNAGSVPILIVAARSDHSSLASWSGGQMMDCGGKPRIGDWQLQITASAQSAQELSGMLLSFRGQFACALELSADFTGHVLIRTSGVAAFPAFVETASSRNRIFVAAALLGDAAEITTANGRLIQQFSSILPVMLFLRQAAGDRAWQAPGPYANLTIDDPWLTSEYGNLDYQALLIEMEKHNFHTTVGFIPWNFDRSDAAVASLFRDYPGRFSISIHGNNHNHAEFGDYRHHPFADQAFSVRQAIARMDEFSRLSGIPYDRVMVFPHSVAPQKTFHALRTSDYWSTINSENVPQDGEAPADPLFLLRPETLAFDNLLSIKRYSAEIPVSKEVVAINAYLGNPNLFYIHQQFFSSGIGAFNNLADQVNRTAPSTKWRSLGYITRHLYLWRRIQDRLYDVFAYSPALALENPEGSSVTFQVHRPQDSSTPVRAVLLDGKDIPFAAQGGEIRFDVAVPGGQARSVWILYGNGQTTASMSITKADTAASVLRKLSDFRDMALSVNPTGRRLIAFYTAHERLSITIATFLGLLPVLAGLLLVWLWRHRSTCAPQGR
jgi:hypothetical protein